MIIIGVDFHPEFQQIAVVDTDTGEFQEKRLGYPAEAEKFYRDLAARAGVKVRVGMEASGHARWFERLMAKLNFELWIGDAAERFVLPTAPAALDHGLAILSPEVTSRDPNHLHAHSRTKLHPM